MVNRVIRVFTSVIGFIKLIFILFGSCSNITSFQRKAGAGELVLNKHWKCVMNVVDIVVGLVV